MTKKISFIAILCSFFAVSNLFATNIFPDGTKIPEWFLKNNEQVDIKTLGKQYRITDYNVKTDRKSVV